jgi:hypothetical protein
LLQHRASSIFDAAQPRATSTSSALGTDRCTKVFGALPTDNDKTSEQDLTDLMKRMNQAGPVSLVLPSERLEIVLTRR